MKTNKQTIFSKEFIFPMPNGHRKYNDKYVTFLDEGFLET